MEIRRHGDKLSTFKEFPDGTFEAYMYYLVDGRWEPPLPIGIEVPGRSATTRTTIERVGARHGVPIRALRSASVTRSGTTRPAALEASPGRPYWQLQREPWRLS